MSKQALLERPVAGQIKNALTIRNGALELDADLALSQRGSRRVVVLVPSEDVLLVTVNLPLSSRRQRMAAAPFAVEGLLAEPLHSLHVVLGPEVRPNWYLVGVVSAEKLAAWGAVIKGTAAVEARLVPDVLAIARPVGDGWTVFIRNGRALVRRGDGAGFAIDADKLATAWRMAGSPELHSLGEPLPTEIGPIGTAASSAGPPLDAIAATFDLRQGSASSASSPRLAFFRRMAVAASIGLALITGLWVADTVALANLAKDRREQARTQLQGFVPGGLPPGADIVDELARLAPDTSAHKQGRFLAVLSAVSNALNGQPDQLNFRSLSYDVTENQMVLEVSARDLATLQRVQATIKNAGIQADSGVATADNGEAQVRIIVRDTESSS